MTSNTLKKLSVIPPTAKKDSALLTMEESQENESKRLEKALESVADTEETIRTSIVFPVSLHKRYKKVLIDLETKMNPHLIEIIADLVEKHEKAKGG